jgi:hypothetical protein
MAFRQHLSADQHVHPILGDSRSHFAPRLSRARRVAIHPHYASTGEAGAEEAFDPLRPLTHRGEILIAARRTRHGERFAVPAQVTNQFLIPEVNH